LTVNDPGTGLAFLACSGPDVAADTARCRQLGIAVYLTKPIAPAELLDAIRAILGAPALDAMRSAPAAQPARRDGRRLQILLAEDSVVNQALAVRLLEKQGHTVVVVGDGQAALAALARQPFDLVLMDVQMPAMDGLKATAAIRAQEHATGAHLPIIALTAHAMHGDRERCLAAGMDGYLAKPIKAHDLDEAIALVACSAARAVAATTATVTY
jgi:two-component system sensor histidine kinase/response regulator